MVGGTTAEWTVTAAENSVTDYEVSAAGGDLAELNGTVTLSLLNSPSIEDLVGHALNAVAVPSLNENTFIVDNQTPVISSIEREAPTDRRTSADSITWLVTFNQAVQNIDAADFMVSGTTAELTVTAVETSLAVYEVSAAGGDLTDLNERGQACRWPAARTLRICLGNALNSSAIPSPNDNAFELDNSVPAVSSIKRQLPTNELTNADSVTWRLTFSEAVQNVDGEDFQIIGTTAGLTVTSAENSLTIYEVNASDGDLANLTGTVTLSLANGRNIVDLAGNALDNTNDPSPNENSFELDNSVPAVASIKRQVPLDERTDADRLVWRVAFTEAVQNVDAANFTLSGSTADLTATAVNTSETIWDVQASDGDLMDLNGTVALSLVSEHNITDFAGNPLNTTIIPSPNQNTFIVNNQVDPVPTISSIERHLPTSERTDADRLVWRVNFSEAVQNVDATDFALSGTTAGLSVMAIGTSGTIYEVSAAGGNLTDLNGTVTLSLANERNITDFTGNALNGTATPSPNENFFVMDNPSTGAGGGTISISLAQNGLLVITYTGTLVSSDKVNGSYVTVTGASSPYYIAPNQAARFYRTINRAGTSISLALAQNGLLVITYTGTLMSSDEVNGAYSPVLGATSPYIVAPNQAVRFYISRAAPGTNP